MAARNTGARGDFADRQEPLVACMPSIIDLKRSLFMGGPRCYAGGVLLCLQRPRPGGDVLALFLAGTIAAFPRA